MMKRSLLLLIALLLCLGAIGCDKAKTGPDTQAVKQEAEDNSQEQKEKGKDEITSGTEKAVTEEEATEEGKDNGGKAALDQAAVRVVAGTVAAAQYLHALGVDVVGIPTTDKTLPLEYTGKAEIGLPMTPSLELVLACEPDLFVSDQSMKSNLEEMFYGQDMELVLLDNNSYASIYTNISILAEKLGLTKEAEALGEVIESKKAEALKLAEGKTQPKVAVIFGTTAMFMLATDNSYTGSLVEMLGAENITDGLDLADAYITFDREKLAELNPGVILLLSHADPEQTAKAFEREFENPFWQEIKAVQDNRVYELDTTYFGVTANFNSIEAPLVLADLLYTE